MGKKRRDRGGRDETDWSTERTMADAEAEATQESSAIPHHDLELPDTGDSDTELSLPPLEQKSANPRQEPSRAISEAAGESHQARCACGSEEFLLEAFVAVVRGRIQPEPVEMEAMTCPGCGREYEAIYLANGQIARGDFLGQTSLDDD